MQAPCDDSYSFGCLATFVTSFWPSRMVLPWAKTHLTRRERLCLGGVCLAALPATVACLMLQTSCLDAVVLTFLASQALMVGADLVVPGGILRRARSEGASDPDRRA